MRYLSSWVQPASQSSAEHGALGLTQSLTDLQVELHEAAAGLRQVPAWSHHGQAACLAQRLVAEVDVQKSVNGVLRLVAKDVVRPQGPTDEAKNNKTFFFLLLIP